MHYVIQDWLKEQIPTRLGSFVERSYLVVGEVILIILTVLTGGVALALGIAQQQ